MFPVTSAANAVPRAAITAHAVLPPKSCGVGEAGLRKSVNVQVGKGRCLSEKREVH